MHVEEDTGQEHSHHWIPVREGHTPQGEPAFSLRCKVCDLPYRAALDLEGRTDGHDAPTEVWNQ